MLSPVTSVPVEVMRAAPMLDAEFLDDAGRLRVMPAAAYDVVDPALLRAWAHLRGFYLLPTNELIAWLMELFAALADQYDGYVIEIGSGNGALGRALGIPCTDSFVQRDNPDVRAYYEQAGQPIVSYGDDVEKLDAAEAIAKYRPAVVLGAWVTQWADPSADLPPGGGSIYGVRETDLLQSDVDVYVHLGNGLVHGRKQIRSVPHTIVVPDGIRSRSTMPCADVAYIWRKARKERA